MGAARLACDQLATALGLDMRDWCEPSGSAFLSQVSKSVVLKAVEEGVSKELAFNFADLKKNGLIKRAEERLTGKEWLPALLRAPVAAPGETFS